MNKRLNNRILALLLAWWLIASFALPAVKAAAPEDSVTLSTAEDWERFVKNCALDAWSEGRTVLLAADLDLSGREVRPVPTFGGTFLGQGHTISGVSLTEAGSGQGLFRCIRSGAVVRDLTVKGVVAPEGSRSAVGGVAGVNEGILRNCAFEGSVTGETAVGGVVGRNGDSGQIIECSAAGTVNGKTAAGGIAGRNAGLLLSCVNRAGVNLTESERRLTLTELDAEGALTDRAVSDEEEGAGLLDGSSDTGGIAGRSTGVIQSCTNHGSVGYPHVGYNVGGIAGRQSGYLAGCVNDGTIHGRKDVGGIVGQAEPWLVLDPGSRTSERLRTELDTLDRLVNRALDDARRTGDQVSAGLTAMGEYAGSARDSAETLLDHTLDFVDDNITEVNTLAADVTGALDKISPALDDLSDVGERVERLSNQLEDALESLEGASDAGGESAAALRAAVKELRQGKGELDTARAELRSALEHLRKLVFPDGFPALPDPDELTAARKDVQAAFQALRRAGDRLGGALDGVRESLREAAALPGLFGDAVRELQDAANTSAAIGRLLESAFDKIGDGVDRLTRNGPPQFTRLGETAREAGDGLFDALSGLNGELEDLNGTVRSGNDTLIADLRAVSRQFSIVCNVLADAADSLDGRREEGIVQDTSDEDIAATREGKAADCTNSGAVEGDRNVGGVVGAVAIELDLDPEDDSAGRFSFGSGYETKAVVQGCVNRGSVTAKKDCAGGVAGRMDLGTALECQNYGPVTSTGGDYTGGIAGFADAMIRGCYAKSVLSGKNYVGGIAGWASRLRDCYAITAIEEGTECLGAVAGGVETDGVLTGNRFVDTGLAGVDGVSYAGRAEPIPFEELPPEVPAEFTAFTLTLRAGGEVVARLPFFYGDDLTRLSLPQVPEAEGCYGVWPEFDTSGVNSDITVEAVYTPWVTLVASEELSGKLPLALAEGKFTEKAVLRVQPAALSSTAPPKGELWDVELTGTDLGQEDEVNLRLLNVSGGRAEVRQYQDGRWVLLDAETNGSYLIVTMRGTEGSFHIAPAQSGLIPAAGAAALAVLAALAVIRKKKKPAKPAGQKEQENQDT